MFLGLLKKVFGTSEAHKNADACYKRQLRELDKREKELDALGHQLHGVSEMQKEKTEELIKTSIELTATLSRSLTPPDMPAVTEYEQEEDERPTREAIPSAS